MLNKCCFIGNLGADPEIKTSAAGKEFAKLSLAVTQKWKDQSGERKEKTEWVRATIFSEGLVKLAKNYLKKGAKIYLEGAMQTSKYVDNAGVEKYSTEIVLQGFNATIEMLDGKKEASEATGDIVEEAKKVFPGATATVINDEIPF